jgi:hypothetical protein
VTTDERMDRLTTIVESLAPSVVHRDDRIGALTGISESLVTAARETRQGIEQLRQTVAATERQWQAYITTLPRH